jgi:hypothetical protein
MHGKRQNAKGKRSRARTGVHFCLLPFAFCLISCGYIGEPLPPSLKMPSRVTDLAVLERGDKILVHFTIPEISTDGVVLQRLEAVELRAGGRIIPVQAGKPGEVNLDLPVRDFVNQDVQFAVRASGPKGRFSDWSETRAVKVVPAVEKPSGFKAEAQPKGVRLSWNAEPGRGGVQYRVFRRAEAEKQPALIARVDRPEFADPDAAFGKPYEYSVQASTKAGNGEAESEVSGPISITPKDIFPPAVPSGLGAVASANGIELAWDPNSEPDLKGYRVYRDTQKIADVETPNYSDRAVQTGKKYRYSVSALDQAGNESQPSAAVEVTAP